MANNFTEQDIRRIAFDELCRRLGIIQEPDIQFLNPKEAARVLGYENVRQLYYLIESGVLRNGIEYQDRRPNGSRKGIYYFNKKACIKRLNTPPEKRAN